MRWFHEGREFYRFWHSGEGEIGGHVEGLDVLGGEEGALTLKTVGIKAEGRYVVLQL